MNETVLTVSSKQPLEIVMQLFKKMGPRVILVESQGNLRGLITIKDILKEIITQEQHHAAHGAPGEVFDAELEESLEEASEWIKEKANYLGSKLGLVNRKRPLRLSTGPGHFPMGQTVFDADEQDSTPKSGLRDAFEMR